MATVMDFGLLEYFIPVFTFLLVFVLAYALLQKNKLLGGNSKLDFIASFAVAILTLFTGNAIGLINYMTPWFAVLIVFAVFIFLIPLAFGWKEKDIWPSIGGKNGVIIVSFLIFIMAMTYVFGDVFNPYSEGVDGEESTGARSQIDEINKTIFHPRVLGAVFILLFASFTVINLKEKIKQED